MSTADAQRYFVIPLSVQKEEEAYLVGNVEMGEFYQFPEQGLEILNMLQSGDTAATIRSRLAAENREMVDVDGFVEQLRSIGFVHPEDQRQNMQEWLEKAKQDQRRTFSVDPRVARAVFSRPASLLYVAIVLYALISAINNPDLRININAFYVEKDRTALLLVVVILSFLHTVMHELGHMLAAARHGIRSKYGIGTRLWELVAESDLTGILTLPKSQRYLPMLAGILVDVVSISLLTIVVGVLLRNGASRFTIQVVQALVLANVLAVAWQFNVFVKTDLYYIICNYFSYPDLDRDARSYLNVLLHRITFGRSGNQANTATFRKLAVVRVFSLVWLFGRLLSLATLFGVVLPTMGRYVGSIVHLLRTPSTSIWIVCDTTIYVAITLSMLGTGTYIWLKRR